MEKFSLQVRGDADGLYMSVPEVAGLHIAKKLKKYKTGVELCSAVGIFTICLAKYLDKVFAVDINSQRNKDARYNSQLYGIEDEKVSFITGDVLDPKLLRKITAEVAVLDPDWSPSENKKDRTFDLDEMQPSLRTMIKLTREYITTNLVIRIPKEYTHEDLEDFGPCLIERISIDGKHKFNVAYFSESIEQSSYQDAVLITP